MHLYLLCLLLTVKEAEVSNARATTTKAVSRNRFHCRFTKICPDFLRRVKIHTGTVLSRIRRDTDADTTDMKNERETAIIETDRIKTRWTSEEKRRIERDRGIQYRENHLLYTTAYIQHRIDRAAVQSIKKLQDSFKVGQYRHHHQSSSSS